MSTGPISAAPKLELYYTLLTIYYMLHTHLPRIISGIMSLLQATKLRNRVYAMEDRLDILEVALEDIERINNNSATPNPLITTVCANVRSHEHKIKGYIE